MYIKPDLSVLVLSFRRPSETRECLESIRNHVKIPYNLIYLENGGASDYAWELHKEGLCDVLISKWQGYGGGMGQIDIFRYCNTEYALFVQSDQTMEYDLTQDTFSTFVELLKTHECIDLNGDQSRKGIWTDRAHMVRTKLLNNMDLEKNAGFGPGRDDGKWNEQYIQEVFANNNYKISHIRPVMFKDNGKWSTREAGDGLFQHRCDTKEMYIIKYPTYKTEVYPPFDESEWKLVLSGKWVDGTIPNKWKPHSFKFWN